LHVVFARETVLKVGASIPFDRRLVSPMLPEEKREHQEGLLHGRPQRADLS